MLSSIFKWACENDFIPKSPATNLQIKQKIAPHTQRKIYSTEDIIKIFQLIKSVNKKKNPDRYWLPLMALYSGARQNEMSQLFRDDIIQVDDIWCMNILNLEDDDVDETKRVKSIGSHRTVPVHPILIELGFIDYVQTCKKQLWPNLTFNEYNGYAHKFQKWFGDANREKVTKDKKKSFHSLRHNFIDNLNANMADAFVLKCIDGHSKKGETEARYAKPAKPARMLEEMKKLNYEFDIIKELEK